MKANSFAKFFPINIFNFIYKIISKVIANRLKSIISLIINPNKGVFISRRKILDGIILAHELTFNL